MSTNISIDNLENNILSILLKDRTTGRNIIWATDDYNEYGDKYDSIEQITITAINKNNSKLIQPRVLKEIVQQSNRTRKRAEIFTPSWLCNEQNNLIDESWFQRNLVFNIAKENTWETIAKKIIFPNDEEHTWEKYIDARRLEISCGEAPYLVSRYDTVTGKYIEIEDRIGLLDRKIRIINENATDVTWFEWTERAYQSIYGYEYQGDNLLLSRVNLLYTFIDYYKKRFYQEPSIKYLKRIARIISWNIWQMDGVTNRIPIGSRKYCQMSLFDISEKNEGNESFCRIKDWRSKTIGYYNSLMKG